MAKPASEVLHDAVHDPDRLKALEKTGLLGTAPEEALDRFTKLASQLLGVKTSLISLVSANREFLKSSTRLKEPWASAQELPLSHSFAKYVLASGEALVIEDTRADERVKDNPAIEELNLLAYAGFPLRTTATGHILGVLCAIDDQPHAWTEKELSILEGLSDAVVARIELREAKEEAETAHQQAEAARQEAEAAQKKAERARREAEEANEAKSRFVANMSHELRTPLNAVIGYSEMFMDDPREWDVDRLKDGLQRIHYSGEQLLELINDVLNLSKAETGHLSLSPTTFSLDDLVENVTEQMRPAMREHDNDLEVQGLETVGRVHTDKSKVRQILRNLLSNAAKYTENGTVTVKAETHDIDAGSPASTEEKGKSRKEASGQLVLSVADDGIGMTEEEQEKVFVAFERGEEAKATGGTGLGLGIVQNLCHLLGGSVEMESEKGGGSRFTVRLPTQSPPPEDENRQQHMPHPTDALPPRKDDLVLVIDDNRDARLLLRNHLHDAGFDVETASSGIEGLEQAHELHPMAITLDVLMDDMDGWEVLVRLKENPDLRHIPVVMITITGDEQRGFQLGAADHLVKPIDHDHLIDLIETYRGTSKPSVLVIDDDKATRDVVRHIIEDKAGHSVREAENGRAALDLLHEGFTPSLVLLDLVMPELDGFEFLAAAREHDYLEEVPVVVLTAKDLTDSDLERLNGQVERIVQKEGYTPTDLLHEVRERVEKLRERSPSAEA